MLFTDYRPILAPLAKKLTEDMARNTSTILDDAKHHRIENAGFCLTSLECDLAYLAKSASELDKDVRSFPDCAPVIIDSEDVLRTELTDNVLDPKVHDPKLADFISSQVMMAMLSAPHPEDSNLIIQNLFRALDAIFKFKSEFENADVLSPFPHLKMRMDTAFQGLTTFIKTLVVDHSGQNGTAELNLNKVKAIHSKLQTDESFDNFVKKLKSL